MTKRIVITGMGIVSPLGNDIPTVLDALQQGRSGIRHQASYQEAGLRCQVAGNIQDLDVQNHIERSDLRFMSDASAFSHIAMQEAIKSAGLTEAEVSNPRSGIIAGSGGASTWNQIESIDILRERGVKRMGPYRVTRTMGSTVSACLATSFKIKGVNYSISSACSTSAHCIGNAMELIQWGKQDLVFAGGGEEEHWTLSSFFDAMGALSTKHNDAPTTASRTYDVDRDGFVIAGGGGIIVLESLEHAQARGANILAEVIGYGATSDGYSMVAPSGEGAVRCMQQALATTEGTVDYINAHGTSTPVGDVTEVNAVKETFEQAPPMASTKSLSGHSLGAAGVHEAIYCLLMMQHNFIAASANVDNLDPEITDVDIVTERRDTELNTIMSNSFGFGGTNATLVMQRFNG